LFISTGLFDSTKTAKHFSPSKLGLARDETHRSRKNRYKNKGGKEAEKKKGNKKPNRKRGESNKNETQKKGE
jgi:hypothetical protein